MNKKKNWSKWFDQLDDERISYLFNNKDRLKNLDPDVDDKILSVIKNSKNYNKKHNIFIRLIEFFAINGKFLKFSLATLVVIACLLYGFLYKDIFIYKSKKTSHFLITSIRGNGYYVDENGIERSTSKNQEIKKELILLTDEKSNVTVSKKDIIQIELKQNSKIKINDENDMSSAFLFNGIALFDINKKLLKNDFIVESFLFNIIVTGTKFTVSINEKGFSKIDLDRGRLKVKINYNYADEVKILKNKDKRFALKINKIFNEYINLISGTTLLVKMNDYLESKKNIKEFLYLAIKDYNNNLFNEDKEAEIILKIKENILNSYILIKPEKSNLKENNDEEKDKNINNKYKIKKRKVIEEKPEKVEVENKYIENQKQNGNLIGEWLFNGNAMDSSLNGNNGEVKGAKLTKDRFGKENSAYYFDGKSYIKIRDNSTLKNIEKTNLFSISIWFNIKQWNQIYFPIFDKYSEEKKFGFSLECNSNNGLELISNYKYFYADTIPQINSWYHIVVINDSKNNKKIFYINGRKVQETANSLILESDSDLYIGYGPSEDKEYAIGTIDDLKIYNCALSEDQVKMLYSEGGWDGKDKKNNEINNNNLIGEWMFNGNVYDSTINDNNGELKGTKLTKDRFGNENSACYFDGKSFIKIKNNSALKKLEKTNIFSMSAWINIEKWDEGYFPIFDKYSKKNKFGYVLDANKIEGINFNNMHNKFYSEVKPESGLWYHIVFINDGKNNKRCFYINGKKIKEENNFFKLNSDSDLYIGYSPSNGNKYATGIIDDFRIYNIALSDDQINMLYNEDGWTDEMFSSGNIKNIDDSKIDNSMEKVKSTKLNDNGLIVEWLFNGNTLDSSRFSNKSEIKGAKLTNDRFGNENSAYYFDGKSYIKIPKNNAIKYIEQSGQISISVWINIKEWYKNYFSIIDFCSKEDKNSFYLNSNSSDGIGFMNYLSDYFSSKYKTKYNLWYHIVFINDRKNNRIGFYINGRKINENKCNMLFKNVEYITIGYSSIIFQAKEPIGLVHEKVPVLEHYAIGSIDDLRIFDYVLSKDQIKNLYNEGGWTEKMQSKK